MSTEEGIGTLTSAQIRAGRALLGLSQTDLGGRAGLSLSTIKRAERETVSVEALTAIRAALERAGVVFTEDPVGVALKE